VDTSDKEVAMRKWVLVLLAVAALGLAAVAAELEGVSLPNTVSAGGATLHLNGMGVRIKKEIGRASCRERV